MKRLLAILLFVLLVALFALPATALAEDVTYLEIDRDNVCLYENTRRAAALFVIPRTYYVKVLDAQYDADYLLVEYNGVQGLVKSSDVSGKTLTNVQNPYYTATNISAHINSMLYAKPTFSSGTNTSAYGLSLTYLGKVQGEKGTYGTATWFAVLEADQVYFIHSAMTENLDLLESAFAPVHPNSVAAESASAEVKAEEEAESKPGSSFDTVRLLLILGMIVPIVIILFLLFRPKRRAPRIRRSSARDRYDREEEDYEDY